MPKPTKGKNQSSTGPLLLIAAGMIIIVIVMLVQVLNSQTTGNVVRPSTNAAARVTLTDGKTAFDKNTAVFLDVRDADAFIAGHIPGAVNIPLGELEGRSRELNPNQWIITYCT